MNIFVGALSYEVKDEELKNLFQECGEVRSAKIITDRETGKSKGFGFVEMANKSEGQKAIETLNGKNLKGRTIVVNESRPREDKPARKSFAGNSRGRRY